MQKLIQGIHQFRRETFGSQKEFFKDLSKGQNLEALFITCSDSRIDPNLLTHSLPGDLFIVRNAGNIVPPYGISDDGVSATVEFAVEALNIRDIVICGHSHCGAVKGLLNPESIASLPAVCSWLKHADATRRIIHENYGHLDREQLLTVAIEENVLVQLEHLRTLPAVASGLLKGSLHLHGWVYKIETGEVFAYDFDSGQFVSIAQHSYPKAEQQMRRRTVNVI